MMTTAIEQDIGVGRRRQNRPGVPTPESARREVGRRPYGAQSAGAERTARGLGWFSIALGLAEVAIPRRLAEAIGIEDDDTNRNVLFAYGLREIATGVAILTSRQPTTGVWARVGGDALDLAFLGRALTSDDSERSRVAIATAAVLGVTALDVLTGQKLSRDGGLAGQPLAGRAGRGIQVTEAITIAKPPEEVYRFWRDFSNLPRFMEHLESVQVTDEKRSHWRASAPAGSSVEWDAEIIEDRPNERISWRSVEQADVPNSGTVLFRTAPEDRGTEIHVELAYEPPGGKLGSVIAKLFGEEPSQQVKSDLRRLKQVLETGEVVHSDASIHRGLHPAQPSGDSGAREARR
jgi:uncharacterized membrane protein